MVKNEATVINKTGIHARPASVLVKKATTYKSDIFFTVNGTRVNGKSMLGVLGLAASQDSVIEVEANGEDEAVAAQELANFIATFEE